MVFIEYTPGDTVVGYIGGPVSLFLGTVRVRSTNGSRMTTPGFLLMFGALLLLKVQ